MARIDRNTDRFLQKLGGDLRGESLSPAQVAKLSGAVAQLPAGARITARELDKIAKELQLPSQHKATLIFALFFHKYGDLVRAELKDERALSKGLASVLGSLIERSRKADGQAIAAALSEFFAGYAGPSATVANTGVDLISGSAVKLSLESDRVRWLGKKEALRWQDVKFDISMGSKTRGFLTFDESGAALYKDQPLAKLAASSLYYLKRALSGAIGAGASLENTAAEKMYKALEEAQNTSTAQREIFGASTELQATLIKPDPKTAADAGTFTRNGEGGWEYRRGRSETIPLGRLSIETLRSLSTALSEAISAPAKRSARSNAKEALALARSVSAGGSLLTEVARTLELKIAEEQTQRADSEAALRAALKNYRVARIGAESMNALVRAFGGAQNDATET